jgi:hypothetical protein
VTRARTTLVLSGLLVVLGIAIIVQTALAGGGQIGYLLGPLLVLAGVGRLLLTRYQG